KIKKRSVANKEQKPTKHKFKFKQFLGWFEWRSITNANYKTRAGRGAAIDPQSLHARTMILACFVAYQPKL
ncbi:hypothetical protein M8C21_018389, partial [Ambrosia artemisiifolia]